MFNRTHDVKYLRGKLSRSLLLGTALTIPVVLPVHATATAPGDDFATQCNALQALNLTDVRITHTEVLSGDFTPPSTLADTLRGAKGSTVSKLPTACRVTLTAAPAIHMEVWLPAVQTWNLRLQSVGNGGYAGFIPYDALGNALKEGYVAAATDTGHAASSLDGRFALKPDRSIDEGLVEDFAHRSVHEMTLNAKKLIKAFYHTGPRYSYWNGCSTGGRQGLMEAQRYPTDYDGILAGAPAIHWDRFIVAELWPQVVMQQELGHPIAAEKLTALSKAILATYDNADGVSDGIVANPSQINVPDELIKRAGLNDKELLAVRKIWSGPRDAHGHALWYGLEPSAPFTGLAGLQPFPIPVAYLGLWLQQNPEWDWKQLTYAGYEKLFMESQQRYHAVIGTDNPDLSAFKQAGGKLIMWHGWNDQLIFPKGTIDYHQRLLKAMGGAAHTDDFARLFMAPGVEHCRGGAGPNQIAGMEALTQWVEGEKAPDSLTARKIVDGLTVMERPLCAYPQEAVYDGHGDANTAAAFACTSTPQTKNRSQ